MSQECFEFLVQYTIWTEEESLYSRKPELFHRLSIVPRMLAIIVVVNINNITVDALAVQSVSNEDSHASDIQSCHLCLFPIANLT